MYTAQKLYKNANDVVTAGKANHALHHRSNMEKLALVGDQWKEINKNMVHLAKGVYRAYPFVIAAPSSSPPLTFPGGEVSPKEQEEAEGRAARKGPEEVHALFVYMQVYTFLATHMTVDSGIDAAEEEANSDLSEVASAMNSGERANAHSTNTNSQTVNLNFYFGISYNIHYDASHFVEQLVWGLLWSWYRQLSSASGGRLRLPTGLVTDRDDFVPPPSDLLRPPLLRWADGADTERWSAMLTEMHAVWQAALPAGWALPPVTEAEVEGTTQHMKAWLAEKIHADTAKEEDAKNAEAAATEGAASLPPPTEEEEREVLLLVHSIITFAQHFYHLRRTLSIIFLRYDVATNQRVQALLQEMVAAVVRHNKEAMEAVQAYVVEAMVGREELELMGSLPQTPLGPRRYDSVSCRASPKKTEHGAVPLEALRSRIEAADLRMVHAVVWMVEECHTHQDLLATMAQQLAQCCARHGWATARTVLERVCGRAPQGLPATSTSTAVGRSDSWAGGSFVPMVEDANKALRLAAEVYTCLRGTLLLLLSGTSHYLDHVTQFGRRCLIEGLESFLVGFCTHPATEQFVQLWSVELWLQLCRATLRQQQRLAEELQAAQSRRRGSGGGRHRRKKEAVAEEPTRKPSDSAASSHPTWDGAESTITRSLLDARSHGPDEDGVLPPDAKREGAVQARGHALPPRALTGQIDAQMRHELREVAARPVEGFPTLLNLLPRRHAIRRRLLDSFSNGVAQHLQRLLEETQPTPPATATILPQPVFERCIFAVKMTVQAFFQDDPLPVRAVDDDYGKPPTVPKEAEGRQASAAALSADDAVRAGLSTFFASTAASVELTLAQALHAQLLEDLSSPTRTATLEVVDTLLDLASLLPNKESFLLRYKCLVAPRLMHVATLSELDADTEVFSRMALRLGTAVTAPCFTLLRDLRQSISESQRAAPPEVGDRDATTRVLSLARLTRPPQPYTSFQQAVGPHLLLRHVRVLCQAWWQPHAPALVTSGRLRRLYEREGWLHPAMVDAVLRMEHFYRDEHGADGRHSYVPYSGPGSSAAATATAASPSSSRSAQAAVLSPMARGVSSALNTVQQGSSRLYGNVRRAEGLSGGFGNDDPDDDAAFSEAYGGLLPPAAMAMTGYLSNHSTVSSVFGDDALSDGGSTVVSAVAEGGVEQRRLQWPLSCGSLTFSIAARRPGGRQVVVGGPPLVLLFLQALAREPGGCSFEQLLQRMPVRAPKSCWRYMMKALVANHIVERTGMDAAEGEEGLATKQQFLYRLSDDFASAPQHKVRIDLTPVLMALPPDAPPLPSLATVDGVADLAAGRPVPDRESTAAAAAVTSPASVYPPSSPTFQGATSLPPAPSAPPSAAAAAAVINIEEVAAKRAFRVELVVLMYLKQASFPPALEEPQQQQQQQQRESEGEGEGEAGGGHHAGAAAAHAVAHSHLLSAVAERLSGDFLVTNPLLKKALTKLIGKGLVARTMDGKSYYYLP